MRFKCRETRKYKVPSFKALYVVKAVFDVDTYGLNILRILGDTKTFVATSGFSGVVYNVTDGVILNLDLAFSRFGLTKSDKGWVLPKEVLKLMKIIIREDRKYLRENSGGLYR